MGRRFTDNGSAKAVGDDGVRAELYEYVRHRAFHYDPPRDCRLKPSGSAAPVRLRCCGGAVYLGLSRLVGAGIDDSACGRELCISEARFWPRQLRLRSCRFFLSGSLFLLDPWRSLLDLSQWHTICRT